MTKINSEFLKQLYRPAKDSHKGQNGKLTIIGGSKLFHGASLWALKTASRIVDMVFYATLPENEKLTRKLKSQFYDFIVIPRDKIEEYIDESDAVLMGPGMTRTDDTYQITQKLLRQFPDKKWVLDAGSLQMMETDWLRRLKQVIITPHKKEFVKLFQINLKSQMSPASPRLGRGRAKLKTKSQNLKLVSLVKKKAKEYGCIIVLKGQVDIICNPQQCLINTTGNEGMTKGGTGDVLAGLIAALVCKNDLFLAAGAGAYINGLAGDELYRRVGPYFNATDLGEEIPKILAKFSGKKP